MSIALLLLDQFKSWLNIRVNNLTVDGVCNISGGTGSFNDITCHTLTSTSHVTVGGELYTTSVINEASSGIPMLIRSLDTSGSASSISLFSDNGGINLEPASSKFITAKQGIKFTNATVDYTPTGLDYYEKVAVTGSWSGAASSSASLNIIRIGKQVTITCAGCAAGSYSAATLVFSIPERFRPSAITYFTINGVDNSAAASLTAIIYDSVTIGVGPGAVNFTAAPAEVKPFSVTYNLA